MSVYGDIKDTRTNYLPLRLSPRRDEADGRGEGEDTARVQR